MQSRPRESKCYPIADNPFLSVVIPCFNEQEGLDELY